MYEYGYEPKWEDEWKEIPYDVEFDMPVAFKIEFYKGDDIEDESIGGWEYEDTWTGDYHETLTDADSVYERVRDALIDTMDAADKIPEDGIYEVTANAEFIIYVNEVYIGIDKSNLDEINTENVETTFSDIKITNIKIERLDEDE